MEQDEQTAPVSLSPTQALFAALVLRFTSIALRPDVMSAEVETLGREVEELHRAQLETARIEEQEASQAALDTSRKAIVAFVRNSYEDGETVANDIENFITHGKEKP